MNRLRNLGPVSSAWLAEVGVHTQTDLEAVGAVEAYCRARIRFPDKVSLNLLWGLLGAELDLPWNEIPPDIKARAQAAADLRLGI